MKLNTYRDLIVWQKAMEFVKAVYPNIQKFPSVERNALSDQLRRSLVSIPSNIAEGNGRESNRDYSHFLTIARGSLYEAKTQLELAIAFGYMEEIPELWDLSIEIEKMLTTMINRLGMK